MGSYFIFAIALTVLYIIYYAVNIARDLYGKKAGGKTDEEVFDLGPMEATEESVNVSESETGFSVGGERYDTEAETVVPPAAHEGGAGQQEDSAQVRFEQLKAKAESGMEDAVPYLSDAYTEEDLYKAMVSGGRLDNRPALEWEPVRNEL